VEIDYRIGLDRFIRRRINDTRNPAVFN